MPVGFSGKIRRPRDSRVSTSTSLVPQPDTGTGSQPRKEREKAVAGESACTKAQGETSRRFRLGGSAVRPPRSGTAVAARMAYAALERRPLRPSPASKESGLYAGGAGHAGPLDRRQHRHLQRAGRGPVAPGAVPRAGPPGAGAHALAPERQGRRATQPDRGPVRGCPRWFARSGCSGVRRRRAASTSRPKDISNMSGSSAFPPDSSVSWGSLRRWDGSSAAPKIPRAARQSRF